MPRGKGKSSGVAGFIFLMIVSTLLASIALTIISVLMTPFIILFSLAGIVIAFVVYIGTWILVWLFLYRIFYKGRRFR